MPDPYYTELLGDPLSEIARKERRNLLFASTAGIAIAAMNMVPTKLSALGIEFSPPAQNSFLLLVAVVIAYFFFAFVTYGLADFFVWRKQYQDHLVRREQESRDWSYEDQMAYDELHDGIPRAEWLYNWHTPVAFIRLSFEFLVPLITGLLSICMLLIKLPRP